MDLQHQVHGCDHDAVLPTDVWVSQFELLWLNLRACYHNTVVHYDFVCLGTTSTVTFYISGKWQHQRY